jgi:hypothetical protein
LIPYYQMLWDIAQKVWAGISAAVSWAWNNVIQPAWVAIQAYINTVLIPVFNTIKAVVSAVWSSISGAISTAWGGISTVFGWLTSAIDGIKSAFSSVADVVRDTWNGITGIVRSVLDGVKNAWNNTVGGKGISIPGFLGFGGIDMTIPRLHSGGIVPGAPGSDVLTILQAGERVTSVADVRSGSRGGNTYQIIFQGPVLGTDAGPFIVDQISRYEKRNGTAWRN